MCVMQTFAGVSNLWPMGCMQLRMAMNVAQHKIVNLLKTLWDFSVIMCCNVFNAWSMTTLFLPEMQKGWTPLNTVPRALIHWNQPSTEIRNWHNKGCLWPCPASAPRESCCVCQAGKSYIFYTDWPLTGNGQLIHQKPYITRKKLGQSKLRGEGAGKHSHHLPWKLNSTPWGWPSVLTHPVTP